MKLPPESIIASSKVTGYLLAFQKKNDKSRFLARAGYDASHADRLICDLREQILPCEAEELECTEYGQYYQIVAPLTGPNGRTLHVRTIWMKEHLSQRTKFITLIPDGSRNHEI